MKVTIFGTGYVGLVTGTCLAEMGNHVTEWKAFRAPDFARVKALLKNAVIFDGRNLYDPVVVEEAGIAYYGIGRGRSLAGRHDD